MTNQVIIIGRLVSDPQINETKNENEASTITLAVPRSYKNVNGEYEIDFIKCTLYHQIAKEVTKYCLKGDLIGIHGRLECLKKELKVVVEKATFLASKK